MKHVPRRVYQMPIAFPTMKVPLKASERSKVITLLSRLILQVAIALKDSEVSDDHS
jgi:hypothetical protein